MLVALALEGRLGRPILLQRIEVLEEQEPRRLLGVIQLAGASGILPQDVVDVLEDLLKHGASTAHGGP